MSAQSWRRPFLLILPLVVHIHAARMPAQNSAERIAELESLPVIEVVKTLEQPRTNFTGMFHSNYDIPFKNEGDDDLKSDDERLYLSWEIAWPRTGKRIDQFIRFRDEEQPEPTQSNTDKTQEEELPFAEDVLSNLIKRKHRGRRNIYGLDNRVYIPSRSYGRRFPFASVVKLSTGCTGTLVSPKHVLTAAHCIHNQTDYVRRYRDLSVAILPSSTLATKFTWLRVNQTFLPTGWLIGDADIASRFDYCLLELESTHSKPYFELAISEGRTAQTIHFTAYDDDKPTNTLWYRQCRVEDTDDHVLYHRCDAKHGSSGAGVYAWNYNKDQRSWQRRLIGVFSGNRWKYYKEWWKKATNYNAAIRLNTSKYMQLCGWMGKYAAKSCKIKTNKSD